MRSHYLEDFRIPLNLIKTGITEFKIHAVPWENLKGEGYHFQNTLNVIARITTVGEDYLVNLEVQSEGEFECDRCRDIFRRHVTGCVQSLYTFHAERDWQEIDKDIKVLEHHLNEIDITEDVRDALILAVPVKILCHESCKGLCPSCGINLNHDECQCTQSNIDPRWEGLNKYHF